MADYTNWPVLADVQLKLDSAGITLRAGATTAYKQTVLDSVTAETERRCRRTFVPAAATRYFDGSGTPELEVDEYVSLTSLKLVSDAGSAVYTFPSTQWHAVEETGRPRTRVQLTRGAALAGGGLAVATFPVGRRNVEVVASWGYASAVPRDLWDAVAGKTAARLADEGIFAPAGRVDYDSDGTNILRYNLGIPGVGSGHTQPGERNATWPLDWHRAYAAALRTYARPRLSRRVRAGMV